MNSNMVIAALVQLLIVCTPLAGRAAVLVRDTGPDQLRSIDRELYQDCLKRRDLVRGKNHRITVPHSRVWNHPRLQQVDLLRELLDSEGVQHGSTRMAEIAKNERDENNRQENLLLEEFTAETTNP